MWHFWFAPITDKDIIEKKFKNVFRKKRVTLQILLRDLFISIVEKIKAITWTDINKVKGSFNLIRNS